MISGFIVLLINEIRLIGFVEISFKLIGVKVSFFYRCFLGLLMLVCDVWRVFV